MSTPFTSLYISPYFLRRISSYLSTCLPEEGCGLLAGQADGQVETIFFIENKLHSSTRYDMNEVELVNSLIQMEQKSLVLLAIFHSHPNGSSFPSQTDIREFNYYETSMLIFSRLGNRWNSQAFQINQLDGTYNPIQILRNRTRKRRV